LIWRPWIVAALLISVGLIDALLLFNEQIPSQQAEAELRAADERLRSLQYIAGQRRNNLVVMGMSPELADATAEQIGRLAKHTEKFERLLNEQASEVASSLCPSDLPQPYAALSFLVYEENGKRYVVDAASLLRFERQPWFDAAYVPTLYDHFERTVDRRGDATLMAISAALLNREEAALEGESPWSSGVFGGWGFDRLQSKDPKIRTLAIEYFSLMHYLTELANAQKGICAT
jgi:hypothetical protein